MRGQLIKRGENTWLLRVYLGEVDGKRKYQAKTVHGTKKFAEAELRKWVQAIETGTYVEPSKVTVGELLDRWLRDWAADNVGPTSYERYESIVRQHIKPAIGHVKLSKLNVLMVNDLYATKRAEGLSPRTLRLMHAVLHNALKAAVRWRLIPTNPADGADLPRVGREEVKALLPEQARTLLRAAEGTPLHIPVLLGLTTGMRIGEICALRWDDVNLEAGTLSITQTLARTSDRGLFLKPAKTKRSARLVEIGPDVVRALKAHKVAQAQQRLAAGETWEDNGLVVCGPDGKPIRPSTLNRQLQRLMKDAGLPVLSTHALRHTAATLMLTQGIHPKVVQERLGHASVSITLDLYSHVTPGLQRKAAEAVEGALFGPPGKAAKTTKNRA